MPLSRQRVGIFEETSSQISDEGRRGHARQTQLQATHQQIDKILSEFQGHVRHCMILFNFCWRQWKVPAQLTHILCPP